MKFYIMGSDERFDILRSMVETAPEDEADMIIPTPNSGLRGNNVLGYAADEEYLMRNADITAEGAVFLLMQELDRSIYGRRITIVGSGRIAKMLAYKLVALGAKVTVACRSEKERILMSNLGIAAVPVEKTVGSIIFNTVPEIVIDLGNLKRGTLLIELASKPGGFDKEEAEKLGMRVISAPGLPAKYAPRSAAEAIYDYIKKTAGESAENG